MTVSLGTNQQEFPCHILQTNERYVTDLALQWRPYQDTA